MIEIASGPGWWAMPEALERAWRGSRMHWSRVDDHARCRGGAAECASRRREIEAIYLATLATIPDGPPEHPILAVGT